MANPEKPKAAEGLPAPLEGDAPDAAGLREAAPVLALYDRGSTQATYRFLLGQQPFDQQPQTWDQANALLRQASDMAAAYRDGKKAQGRTRLTTTKSFYEIPARCPACGGRVADGQTYCSEHVGSRIARIGESLIRVLDDE